VQDLRAAVSKGEDESDVNIGGHADFPSRSVQASGTEEREIVVLNKTHFCDSRFPNPKDSFRPCVVGGLHVNDDVAADNFVGGDLRLHRRGLRDFRHAVLNQTELSALRVLDDPLLQLRVVVANIENVLVVGSASQCPPQTPGSPKAAGAEREECVSALVTGHGIAEVSVVAAECNGGIGLCDVATVTADGSRGLRKTCVAHCDWNERLGGLAGLEMNTGAVGGTQGAKSV